MGLPLSLVMANIYMDYFEEFAIESSLVKEAIDAIRCTNTVEPCKLNKTFHIVHARAHIHTQ